MASVNRVIVDVDEIQRMYVSDFLSIPQISSAIGVSQSTVRNRLHDLGVLRARTEAIRVAAAIGRLGSGLRGKTRTFTEDWCRNISTAKLAFGEKFAKGVAKKTSGYMEFTRGQHKGRMVHVVTMEESIGRRILPDEVVHHIDENKANNQLTNLQLMTRSEHSALHSQITVKNRKRDSHGKFE